MSVTSLGDLSHSYAMRQRNVALRQDIDKLTTELATGQVADVRDVLGGNYSYLTDIERRDSILAGYNVATTEATLYAGGMQDALGLVQSLGATLSSSLITAGTLAGGANSHDTVAEGRATLDSMLGTLNLNSAGRYMFSGTAIDTPALPDSQTIIDALRTAVSGAATPDDLLAAATAWFDDPAGFEATVYQGSASPIAPFQLSQSDQIALDVRATDPKLKEVLKLAAVVSLADDPSFGFDVDTQAELFGKTGQSMLGAQDGVIALRADVGFVESRIDKVAARNAAEVTGLEFAKAALLQVDPFEAATRLEEAQFQLESLYSVTVRMSQLSLVKFL
ncbi:Flagellar hook-associated protein FlgL [Sulfitobacter noctilucae]|uniref:flagellin n=1 Tax=Sulfitobacter noctilucae TaxID=1342302 RepID=UPI000469B3A2|nr:flagellin [Sulfitobacter noctilucae]KIN75401.1 Flagellar hook-associated protein FlgL [Sulfitobacter noctilucae]